MDNVTRIAKHMYRAVAKGSTGGTYNVNGKALPVTGYFVGRGTVPMVNPSCTEMANFIEQCPTDYVGYWEDSETLALYLDAVTWCPSLRYAQRLAELRGEISYWDIHNGQEVRTDSDAPVLAYASA